MSRTPRTLRAAWWPILVVSLELVAFSAFAQNDMAGMNMQGMDMKGMDMKQMHTPAAKPRRKHRKHKSAAPAPAGSSLSGGARAKPKPPKQQMHDMDMSPAADTKVPPQPPAKSTPPPPATSSAGQSMHGMDMQGTTMSSMQVNRPPAQTAPVQHLHFGHMIGDRPRPEGLARSARDTSASSMGNMDMAPMQGGAAPRDARNPDDSDGYGYTAMPGMTMSDHSRQAMLLLDQFEYARGNHGDDGAFLDGQLWYGEDFNKLWLKSEGEFAGGKLEDLRTEALWSHAISSYWDSQLGVRQDLGEGPRRTWAALGIQGLAPYWFDIEATVYVRQNGRTAARLALEYQERLTQRLVLQPRVEMNLYGNEDRQRGLGSGLADTEIGMLLRYELERRFAPYLGLVWRQRYDRTADLARAQGKPAGDLQLVAGLHVWL